ncbi:uncharacterized protein YndB with AHSA1/START domain [Salinibacterium sp. CAN_S4]|uniref:SRPBCC family protein n=1 Tax=Salinibacterium sp. CAN_S4 TaxID=2787727 RepID=UPI0018EF5190
MTDGIVVTRSFASTPDEVFSAWTTPAHFSEWFGTSDIPVDSVTMDVRVGGTWAASMHLADGNTIDWMGEYTEVDRPARLAFTMTDTPADDAREPVVIEISAVEGGAQMTLSQAATDFGPEQIAATAAGYNLFFDDMESVLASL